MTMTFIPLRISSAAALALVLAGGCAASPRPPSTAGASPPMRERDAVVTCFSTDYRKRSGFSPVLDTRTDSAAEQLLKKQNGNVKRSCDAIASALSTASCGGATTLGSLLACDPRLMRAPDIDPASKSSLENSVRERGMGDQRQPGPSGF